LRIAGCSVFILMTVSILAIFSGHDFQRFSQVIIILLAWLFYSLFFIFQLPKVFGGDVQLRVLFFLFLFLLLGFWSSLCSHQVVWSFVEFSLLVALCVVACFFCMVRKIEGKYADKWLCLFVVLLCGLKILQFSVLVGSAIIIDATVLNTDQFISGFSNKRFYGQFQTFTLPLLALPLLFSNTNRPTAVCVFSLLSFWWLIAVTGGTRGTWLGMSVAACVLFICGHSGRRWISWQLSAVVVGVTLYWLLFSVLTGYLGIEVSNFASDRLTTSLSGRGPIWQQAWDMIRERPWLGFGPMHFADIHNPIAAHPHQAILQWASEWGIPSTLLVMWLVGRGLWATFRLIRERSTSDDPTDLLRLCLFASLIGALTQSMVDGVIVMPYSQLWLSLVVGWLMALHVWKGEPAKPNAFIHWSWMGISTASVLFLVYVVIRDVPHLDERNKLYQQQYGGHFQPRFWVQGVIAIKPE